MSHEVAWFMHEHPGHGNTLVGIWPTPIGTYVRSIRDDTSTYGIVTFYPMQPGTRVIDTVVRFSQTCDEHTIRSDVLDHYRQRCKKLGRTDPIAETI